MWNMRNSTEGFITPLSKIHRIERKEISYKSNAWSVGKQEWPCHVVYVFRGRREFS